MLRRKELPYVSGNLLVDYGDTIIELGSEEWRKFISIGLSFRYEFFPTKGSAPIYINCYRRNVKGFNYWYASKCIESVIRAEYIGKDENVTSSNLEYIGYLFSFGKSFYEKYKEDSLRYNPKASRRIVQILQLKLQVIKENIEARKPGYCEFAAAEIIKDISSLVDITNTN